MATWKVTATLYSFNSYSNESVADFVNGELQRTFDSVKDIKVEKVSVNAEEALELISNYMDNNAHQINVDVYDGLKEILSKVEQ